MDMSRDCRELRDSHPAAGGVELNLLNAIDAQLARRVSGAHPARLEVRRDERPYGDIGVFGFRDRSATETAAAALAELPAILSVKPSGAKLSLRLEDDHVDAVGRLIEEGALPSPPAEPSPRPARVGFLGANLSKALHIGHLRNIVLGNAVASMLKAAGRPAHSYSLVGDIGRNVCEAMAGWRLHHAGTDPEREGIKPDTFIGTCYRDYLAESGHARERNADPCGRELAAIDDPADRLLRLWSEGDPEVRAFWRRTCALVERGHRETLWRLGIAIDLSWRESDHVAAACELVERGVAQGIFRRDSGGMVVYDTGREEYRRMILKRSDGFPTEYARVIAVFSRLLREKGGCEHFDWNGTEWEPAQRVMALLLDVLELLPAASVHRPLFHGMVLVQGEELSSGSGAPLLIDALLDQVRDSAKVRARSDHPAEREALGAIVVMAFFLCAPVTKPLSFSWQRLMAADSNPGWTIADAWARAGRAPPESQGRPPVSAGAYRVSVLQALGFGRDVSAAARDLRISGVTKFLTNYCGRFLQAPPCPRHDRLARTLIEESLRTIGLLPLSDPV